MSQKPKILIFIDWYVPAYKAGGPIRSVYTTVETFSDRYEFFVITSNTDIDNKQINVETDKWCKQGSANVLYLTKDAINSKRFVKEVEHICPKFIYLNSLFSHKFTLQPLSLFKNTHKVILAPRGMLGKESLAIKPLKKKLFLSYAKLFGVYKNVYWHATSEIEKEEIIKVFGEKSRIFIEPNIALVPNTLKIIPKRVGELSLIMVGRIVPIKNILFLLEVLKEVDENNHLRLTLIGPVEDTEYWNRCQQAIKELPKSVNVQMLGAQPPEQVRKQIENNHLLVSTSLNENFGHSIAEALSLGRPVLVSEHTPWKDLKQKGIGADLPLSVERFKRELVSWINYDDNRFSAIQQNVYQYAKNHFVPKVSIFEKVQQSIKQ